MRRRDVRGYEEMPWNFHGPDHADAVSFIRSFCVDYTTWNNGAVAVSHGLSGERARAAIQEASLAYSRFLAPFLAPATKPQLIAFGTNSSFDPSRIRIVAVEDTSTGWNVKFSIKNSRLEFEDDYVADVEKSTGGKLVLTQIWYLDPFPEAGQERLEYL